MFEDVDFFEANCKINAGFVEQAGIIAKHMHETGEAEDALVWLLDELDSLVRASYESGLDSYFKLRTQEAGTSDNAGIKESAECTRDERYGFFSDFDIAHFNWVEDQFGTEVAYDLVMSALRYAIYGVAKPLYDVTDSLLNDMKPTLELRRDMFTVEEDESLDWLSML